MAKSIDMSVFNSAKVDECGEAFGLICLVPGTTAYEYSNGEYVFAIGFNEDNEWCCQIDDNEGGCVACWQGDTPQEALENAAAEADGNFVLHESDNCEDAVNAIAYLGYAKLNENVYPETPEEYEQLDRMLLFAREYVKKFGPSNGIVWEEF